MVFISDHAAVKYANRVMGIEQVKDTEDLSFVQMKSLKCKILVVLDWYIQSIHDLVDGWFIVDGVAYVIENNVVITVKNVAKDREGQTKRFKGGITSSGKKIKKCKKTSKYDRRSLRDL